MTSIIKYVDECACVFRHGNINSLCAVLVGSFYFISFHYLCGFFRLSSFPREREREGVSECVSISPSLKFTICSSFFILFMCVCVYDGDTRWNFIEKIPCFFLCVLQITQCFEFFAEVLSLLSLAFISKNRSIFGFVSFLSIFFGSIPLCWYVSACVCMFHTAPLSSVWFHFHFWNHFIIPVKTESFIFYPHRSAFESFWIFR